MIILGITTDKNRILLNQQGERVYREQSPDSIILGLEISAISSKRIWVDAELSDEQKMPFLKHRFGASTNHCIDYECIKSDQGRELLHVYSVPRNMLLHTLKQYKFKAKTLYVETSLHGLGRALAKRCGLGKKLFHCISFFNHAVLFSVHSEDVLVYHQLEPMYHSKDSLCAARRAFVRYQCDDDRREIVHIICLSFTPNRSFEDADFLTESVSYSRVSYEECRWIIPYGLALRGVM